MTTTAPIRKVHDIPIVEPAVEPRRLPAPDPGRIVRPIRVPVHQPERVKAW